MQPKQQFSFSSKVSILMYWKLVQVVIYILSVEDSKNFIWNRYFHGNVHLWWDVVPQMLQLKNFVSSGQGKKQKSGGQNNQKPRLTGKHAMLQVNGLKCQLVNRHKAGEVDQSSWVNGAMLIYTEDLALGFNRTSLASCFSAYPSSYLFNKLSVILGLSFNNSAFSLHRPSSFSGDNGMGFSACSPHRNIVDRLNSAQLATGF